MFNIRELAQLLYDRTLTDTEFLSHRNMVVVGNNSTGKSTLLKVLLDKIIENNNEEFYYLDSQNRIVIERLEENLSVRYSDFDVRTIINARRDVNYFAKADVFTKDYSGGAVTFSELMADIHTYNILIKKFMPVTLNKGSMLKQKSFIGGSETIYVNDKIDIGSISSSEASKIRLIMEINYAASRGCKVVIIDEFDDHFDSDNMVSFIKKLIDNFDKLRFVFVIHNFEVLVRLNSMDAVI